MRKTHAKLDDPNRRIGLASFVAADSRLADPQNIGELCLIPLASGQSDESGDRERFLEHSGKIQYMHIIMHETYNGKDHVKDGRGIREERL